VAGAIADDDATFTLVVFHFTRHACTPALTYSPALSFTPLMIASRDGQLQACELLINLNADIGTQGGPYVAVM
jgi:hypothetical protein